MELGGVVGGGSGGVGVGCFRCRIGECELSFCEGWGFRCGVLCLIYLRIGDNVKE